MKILENLYEFDFDLKKHIWGDICNSFITVLCDVITDFFSFLLLCAISILLDFILDTVLKGSLQPNQSIFPNWSSSESPFSIFARI